MAKLPAFAKAFAGRWRIVEMDVWDKDFLDLVETAHLTFKGAADGEIAFGALNAKAKQRNMALRRPQYAEIREIDRTIQLDSLAILEEAMRHFFWKARILEGMGTEGDFNEVDKAWAETGAHGSSGLLQQRPTPILRARLALRFRP